LKYACLSQEVLGNKCVVNNVQMGDVASLKITKEKVQGNDDKELSNFYCCPQFCPDCRCNDVEMQCLNYEDITDTDTMRSKEHRGKEGGAIYTEDEKVCLESLAELAGAPLSEAPPCWAVDGFSAEMLLRNNIKQPKQVPSEVKSPWSKLFLLGELQKNINGKEDIFPEELAKEFYDSVNSRSRRWKETFGDKQDGEKKGDGVVENSFVRLRSEGFWNIIFGNGMSKGEASGFYGFRTRGEVENEDFLSAVTNLKRKLDGGRAQLLEKAIGSCRKLPKEVQQSLTGTACQLCLTETEAKKLANFDTPFCKSLESTCPEAQRPCCRVEEYERCLSYGQGTPLVKLQPSRISAPLEGVALSLECPAGVVNPEHQKQILGFRNDE
jgi:hypothetical protein